MPSEIPYGDDIFEKKPKQSNSRLKFDCYICGKTVPERTARYMIIRSMPVASHKEHPMHLCIECSEKIKYDVEQLRRLEQKSRKKHSL